VLCLVPRGAAKVTVARRIDVKAAAENGGFAVVAVSGGASDGGEDSVPIGAAVSVDLIQELEDALGPGLALMVSASEPSAEEDEEDEEDAFVPPPAGVTAPAAKPLTVSIAVGGKIVNVRDLKVPILLTVAKKKPGMTCGFYNETTLDWSSEGMWEEEDTAGNGALVCATTHLTMFAALFKGLSLAVTCLPAELLTAEGDNDTNEY